MMLLRNEYYTGRNEQGWFAAHLSVREMILMRFLNRIFGGERTSPEEKRSKKQKEKEFAAERKRKLDELGSRLKEFKEESKAMEREKKRAGKGSRKREKKTGRVVNPSYQRIHRWIESRIGTLHPDDPKLHDKLLTLLEYERTLGTAPRLMGNGDYDPYAGLEAYIRKNAYRQMLE